MKTISLSLFRIDLLVLAGLSFLSYGFWYLVTGQVSIHPSDMLSMILENLGFLMMVGFLYFIVNAKTSVLPQNRIYLKIFLILNVALIVADAGYVFYAVSGNFYASFFNPYAVAAVIASFITYKSISVVRA
ncbi:MAG: hypothetical protein JWN49_257 [Parcubacteria group bacterium]|nr:hypothetical protein [Parcubacteria group bacterium]